MQWKNSNAGLVFPFSSKSSPAIQNVPWHHRVFSTQFLNLCTFYISLNLFILFCHNSQSETITKIQKQKQVCKVDWCFTATLGSLLRQAEPSVIPLRLLLPFTIYHIPWLERKSTLYQLWKISCLIKLPFQISTVLYIMR